MKFALKRIVHNAFATFPMNVGNFVKWLRMIFQRCSTHWLFFNDVDVFTGVDLEWRNLLYKYRGF